MVSMGGQAPLLKEIEEKARANLGFSGHDEKCFDMLKTMKLQLDCHNQNGTRAPKDLCILYKRFIILCDELAIPMLKSDPSRHKHVTLLTQ
jgi:hypothetical protein